MKISTCFPSEEYPHLEEFVNVRTRPGKSPGAYFHSESGGQVLNIYLFILHYSLNNCVLLIDYMLKEYTQGVWAHLEEIVGIGPSLS